MGKYRKKVVIEATQWNEGDVPLDGMRYFGSSAEAGREVYYVCDTLEGPLHVSPGDWIITGINGEKYPCKPDIFEKTYEALAGGEAE